MSKIQRPSPSLAQTATDTVTPMMDLTLTRQQPDVQDAVEKLPWVPTTGPDGSTLELPAPKGSQRWAHVHHVQDVRSPKVVGPVTMEPELSDTGSMRRLVIRATNGRDHIFVQQLRGERLMVTVNNQSLVFSSYASRRLVIRGEAGSDYIEVAPHVTIDLRIEGGAGNDVILSGGGNDYIDGGTGDDLLSGGAGDDVLYGGAGADSIEGGDGNDYLEGGAGADHLLGGSGTNLISTGTGQDVVDAPSPSDAVIANAASSAQSQAIRIVGSPEFVARVEADLAMLRSLPLGRDLLAAIEASGHSVTIEEGPGNVCIPLLPEGYEPIRVIMVGPEGQPNTGCSSIVRYAPTEVRAALGKDDTRPPVIGLVHELIHAHNNALGIVPREDTRGLRLQTANEHAVVGLPFELQMGQRHDPPRRFTENAFRKALGYPERKAY